MVSVRFCILFCLLLVIITFIILGYPNFVFSQNGNMSMSSNKTWTSQHNNLNVTMKLYPEVPIIDQKTKISFEVRTLNDSSFFEGLNAKATMTDHDGRLYKFENKFIPVSNGNFSIEYIFPDDGEHRIILQLYKNTTAFAIGSFDIFIAHPQQPPTPSIQDLVSQILNSIF